MNAAASALVLSALAVSACAKHDGENAPHAERRSITSHTESAPQARSSAPLAASATAADSTLSTPLRLATADSPLATKARRVLHVGDSMVPLVANYLKPAFVKGGATYESMSIASSSSQSWASDSRLRDAIEKINPDLVLISLGSNELYTRDLDERAKAVRHMVSEIGPRACLWIGPPAWAKGFGFLATVRSSVRPCRYFDSASLKFERQKDGRHPTWGSSYRWANEVWKALGGSGELPGG